MPRSCLRSAPNPSERQRRIEALADSVIDNIVRPKAAKTRPNTKNRSRTTTTTTTKKKPNARGGGGVVIQEPPAPVPPNVIPARVQLPPPPSSLVKRRPRALETSRSW